VGSRLEQRLSGPRLVSPRRLGTTPGLVPPARVGSTPGLGRALRRATFQPVPPAALPIVDALSLPSHGAGSEPNGMPSTVSPDGHGPGGSSSVSITLRWNDIPLTARNQLMLGSINGYARVHR
jgi:hypothetical protein